jgi:A/G-specific adenine glycosylase
MLHEGAQYVARELRGAFPESVEGLREIPGVGPYTAGAVASIAFGRPAALVDGNVARVLSRIHAVDADVRGGAGLAQIWKVAESLVFDRDPGAWNQALMELGATVCVPREPRCLVCPARSACRARALGLERELPRLKPKPKPIGEKRLALVVTTEEPSSEPRDVGQRTSVLLARRRLEARFGGMWEPPSVVGDDEAALLAIVGLPKGELVHAGRVAHVLSHRRLDVDVRTLHLPKLSSGARKARAKAPRMGTIPLRPPPSPCEYDRLEIVPIARLPERALTRLARKILAVRHIA